MGCPTKDPHVGHYYIDRRSDGTYLQWCDGVQLKKLRHKHTLTVSDRQRRNTKVLNMDCKECSLRFQYRRVSVRSAVRGDTKNYNPQMLLQIHKIGK